jgi:hypothetical protein
VSVTGLPAGTYDVYVYADGDNKVYSRGATYRVSAPGAADVAVDLIDAENTNFSGTFVQAAGSAGNYVRFVVSGGSFTLTATPGPATSTNQRAPINAVQIVPR